MQLEEVPSARRARLLARLRGGDIGSQAMRYVVVGLFNTVFSFAVFSALQVTIGARTHYVVALVASHAVGILEAYVLQRWLVFQVTGRWWRDLARFASVYAIAFGVNLVALPFFVEVAHLPVVPAQALVLFLNAVGTFAVHRVFTFKRREGSASRGQAASGVEPDTHDPRAA